MFQKKNNQKINFSSKFEKRKQKETICLKK